MREITDYVLSHQALFIVGGLYLFVAVANSLPDPDDPRAFGRKVYATFYTLFHILANKAVEKRPALASVSLGGTTQNVTVNAPAESTVPRV